ncbi:MAG: hypothetical protein BGN85_02395 [Alphaproteobacteria bacterium 64-11]|mgnify:FL=1|nr:hypothetical protein [Alphaproteobacteria bacterium]OJU13620.1 MAG: hypothetical protein BGN85_02395 [Alphaproteobacteria bacterium 64-11]
MKLFAIVAGAALMAVVPAAAQDAPIPVNYTHEKTFRPVPMDAAIDAALATPGFAPQAKPGPGVIVVTAPDGWDWINHSKKDHIQFRLVFTRNGDKIGESEEQCTSDPPYDCAQQIASDIQSAAAIAKNGL